jgi:hypothetical protein
MRQQAEPGTDRPGQVSAMLRARIEGVIAIALGALALLTAIWPEWIEELTGLEPDAGNGAVEWLVVAILAGLALVVALFARRDLRAARAAVAPAST